MGCLNNKVAVMTGGSCLRFMIAGLLREAGRRVTGHAEPLEALQVKVVPSANPVRIDE